MGLRLSVRHELALLIGIAFLVMLVIGLGALFASRSVARAQALQDSARMAHRLAELLVLPMWPPSGAGDPARLTELDGEIQARIRDGILTEVTVWTADAKVLYSSKAEDVGKTLPRPQHLDDALAGRTTSHFEDVDPRAPSTSHNRFVEVYLPFVVPGQPRMVFESHFDYRGVNELADLLLRQILPLVLIPLLVLQLVQIPIAISLALRIKRHESERSRLLERALSVSDRERVRFAADLHDGPIQDLAGISYALGAVAPSVVERHAPLMTRVQQALERSIASLRGLMTDLYPPDLSSGNLDQTIANLANPLRETGTDVQLDLAEVTTVSQESAAALYRVARESLANVQKHAHASTVRVSLEVLNGSHGTDQARVRLVVADDGVGVDPAKMDRRAEGHLGLRLLVDRIESLGGELVVTSAIGQGTSVQADLPVQASAED